LQKYNACKYLSKFIAPIFLLFYPESKNEGNDMLSYYVFIRIFDTMFTLIWDFYMDWGLFRCFERESFALRPLKKMKFSKKFYYFAIVFNTILRFFWIIPIYKKSLVKQELLNKLEMVDWLSIIAEALRRT